MNKQATKQKNRDEAASVIAGIFDLTPRAVRMVINGETTNEPVLEAVMMYKEGKSKLIQEIEKLVPIKQS
jgi:ABC-type sugar transport system substrate-binding protein